MCFADQISENVFNQVMDELGLTLQGDLVSPPTGRPVHTHTQIISIYITYIYISQKKFFESHIIYIFVVFASDP